MSRFLDDKGCRQLALLRHFGDVDGKGACGICDACDPQSCRLRQSRAVTDDEKRMVGAIESRLRTAGQRGMGTGKLYGESMEPKGIDRRSFEHLLAALVRAGRVRIEERSFDNDQGERVRYQSASLVADAKDAGDMSLFVSARADAAGSKGAKKASTTRRAKPAAAAPTRGRSRSDDDDQHDQSDADPQLMARLKAWRLQEAQRKKAPAFTIFSDRVLLALSALPPRSLEALAAVPGISKRLVTSHGRSILAVIAADGDVD